MAIILVVAAHPDDEVLGCGGTLVRHAEAGDEVHVVFLADGESSRIMPAEAAAIDARMATARAAGALLGIKKIHAFGLPDNRLDSLPLLDIVRPLEGLIEQLRPEIIYTHHHGDLNVDHRLAHQAVMTACRPVPGHSVRTIYCFEVPSSTEWQTPGISPFTPNVFVEISPYLESKQQALQVYHRELRQSPHIRSLEAIQALGCWRGNSVGMFHAEAFCMVRSLIV